MDPDPMEYAQGQDQESAKSKSQLNTLVAIAVALLATFMGICKVKDDNIVQAMQQAQADKIDSYSWYQARNIREEEANAVAAQLAAQEASAPQNVRAVYEAEIAKYQAIGQDQSEKKKVQQADAEGADQRYNQLNTHDDQFDLSDALLSIAISLLALSALTGKRWLYWVSMIPTVLGVFMGLAGLLGWGIHPDSLTRLLS
jgi:hypothetical protein